MDDPRRVEVFQSSENLIEEDLDMICGEMLRGDDDFVKVALHKLRDDVYFLEEVEVGRLQDV